ncbi:MAG: hypothetical protein ABI178_13205 [Rhodanobacter sp.]
MRASNRGSDGLDAGGLVLTVRASAAAAADAAVTGTAAHEAWVNDALKSLSSTHDAGRL